VLDQSAGTGFDVAQGQLTDSAPAASDRQGISICPSIIPETDTNSLGHAAPFAGSEQVPPVFVVVAVISTGIPAS
jgi:hypothetical protein